MPFILRFSRDFFLHFFDFLLTFNSVEKSRIHYATFLRAHYINLILIITLLLRLSIIFNYKIRKRKIILMTFMHYDEIEKMFF